MPRVFAPTKTKVIIVAVLLIVATAGITVSKVLHNRNVAKARKTATLSSKLKGASSDTTPTDAYVNSIKDFSTYSTNPVEQAKAYDTLGYAYKSQGKYSEAFEAFKQEKALATSAKLTTDQLTMINLQIQLLTLLINNTSKPYTGDPNGYREPN